MFSISTDDESYHGSYDTIEEAIQEATGAYEYKTFWIGECVPPSQPETLWHAEDWLEHVSCQDEYGSEWAENWDDSTEEQRKELEDSVRKLMAEWLDRYNLRPSFFTIENQVKYTVIDGNPVKESDLSEPSL